VNHPRVAGLAEAIQSIAMGANEPIPVPHLLRLAKVRKGALSGLSRALSSYLGRNSHPW